MKMRVLHVTATRKPPRRTKIKINPAGLADIGFVHGAPVIAVPQQDGFDLILQGENKASETNENGKLIHVGLHREKPTLTLNFTRNFSSTGLSAGDFLAARYEQGIITAKKLPPAQRYYVVSSKNYGAFLQLSGAWLNDSGFLPGAIITVAVGLDCITLRLWNDPVATYSDIVKFARMHQYQVIQSQKNQHITIIDLESYLLNCAGFDTGDISGIYYEYGRITLFRPDLQKLGF